jgi:uncharacterized protein YhjY with autotransporter beta-barrel domain
MTGMTMISLSVPANADITILGQESGGNVVFSYSGSVDLTGLAKSGGGFSTGQNFITPNLGIVAFLDAGGDAYENTLPLPGAIFSGVQDFGPGNMFSANSSTGDSFFLYRYVLGVPVGYHSGDLIEGSMTFDGETFASLGIDPERGYTSALTPYFAITLSFGPPPEQLSAIATGLPMANALGQMLISGNQTATSDVNNHIFGLMAGDGEEAANSSLSASLDEGVVIGQGDGPEDPIARKVLHSRQWELYSTVNYGYLDLNALGSQAGVKVESWAPGIGIERHLSRGLALGFAVSLLQSWQDYSGGLGSLDLEGPALSTYLTFVRKNYWSSLLYSFGSYELDSTRNPGLGFPQAYGSTHSYTNSVQYNTGWNFRFQNNTLLTGPFAGIDYLHGTVDAYSETGGGAAALRYAEQSYESLVTRVGWSASKKIKTDFASITPQVRLSYERQNLENNGTSVALINAPFTAAGGNQSPGQDYLAAGAGVNFAFNDQLSVLLSYQGQFFRSDMSAHMGALRLSYKF